MAKVDITVNGRSYQVGCEDGQEEHLRGLADRFNAHVVDLAERVGQIGDLRLFLMAALMICDELAELEKRRDKGAEAAGREAGEAAALLIRAAERIEALVDRAEASS